MIRLSRFSALFPPPHFLQMRSVGFSLTDNSIRFIELSEYKTKKDIVKYGEEILPEGIMKEGYIEDREKLIPILKKIKERENISFITTSLPEEKTYLYKTRVPIAESEENLRNSVEFSIEDNVPLSLANVTFDYDIVPSGSKDAIDVVVSVVPTKVVSTYSEVFTAAGMIPVSFELESHATAQAVVKRGDEKVVLVVNAESNKTGLYVVSNGVVHFASVVQHQKKTPAVKALTKKASQKNKVEESKTKEESFFSSQDIQILSDEIRKIYDYWNTHDIGGDSEYAKKIEKITICGEGAGNVALVDKLSETCATAVDTANVWTNVFSFDEYVPEIKAVDSLRYATAVGLALPFENKNYNA